jgi:hypothetical protein
VLRRVATWVRDHPDELFAALLVVALPVIVFGLADYVWFFRDDWMFIAERELSLEDVLEPHNAHWTSVPVVAFRALYAAFGLHSYVPYLAVVVTMHLAVVALLRTIMVRATVGRQRLRGGPGVLRAGTGGHRLGVPDRVHRRDRVRPGPARPRRPRRAGGVA